MTNYSARVLKGCSLVGLAVGLVVGAMAGTALTAELQWDRNTEEDMKQYHVYICKVKGCVASDIGADWMATIPQVPATQPRVTWTIPIGIDGGATVTAEDVAGNTSKPAVPINFSTVPNLPPAAPLNLQILP